MKTTNQMKRLVVAISRLVGAFVAMLTVAALSGCGGEGQKRELIPGMALSLGSLNATPESRSKGDAEDDSPAQSANAQSTQEEEELTPPQGGDAPSDETTIEEETVELADGDVANSKDGGAKDSFEDPETGLSWQLLEDKMTWSEAGGIVEKDPDAGDEKEEDDEVAKDKGEDGNDSLLEIPCDIIHAMVQVPGLLSVDLKVKLPLPLHFGAGKPGDDCKGLANAFKLPTNLLATLFPVPGGGLLGILGLPGHGDDKGHDEDEDEVDEDTEEDADKGDSEEKVVDTGCKTLGEEWRLPTLEEVEEALDHGLALELDGADGKTVWTSSLVEDGDRAETIDLGDGTTLDAKLSKKLAVLCVKG